MLVRLINRIGPQKSISHLLGWIFFAAPFFLLIPTIFFPRCAKGKAKENCEPVDSLSLTCHAHIETEEKTTNKKKDTILARKACWDHRSVRWYSCSWGGLPFLTQATSGDYFPAPTNTTPAHFFPFHPFEENYPTESVCFQVRGPVWQLFSS